MMFAAFALLFIAGVQAEAANVTSPLVLGKYSRSCYKDSLPPTLRVNMTVLFVTLKLQAVAFHIQDCNVKD